MTDQKVFYICTTDGNDEAGDGSEVKPLKSLFRAMLLADSAEADFRVATPPKDGQAGKQWDKPSKSAMKKAVGRWEEEKRKREKAGEKAAKSQENNEKRLEDAKKVRIELDASLPTPTTVKIRDCKEQSGQRVKVLGFVHRIRQQRLFFIYLWKT